MPDCFEMTKGLGPLPQYDRPSLPAEHIQLARTAGNKLPHDVTLNRKRKGSLLIGEPGVVQRLNSAVILRWAFHQGGAELKGARRFRLV